MYFLSSGLLSGTALQVLHVCRQCLLLSVDLSLVSICTCRTVAVHRAECDSVRHFCSVIVVVSVNDRIDRPASTVVHTILFLFFFLVTHLK